MTEVQLPLHQNPQKAMNGKFLPKNTLEIRGGGVGNNNNVNNSAELSKNSNPINQAGLSAKKTSLKLIEKSQSNLANIQVYPIKLNSNTEKLDSFSTFVSVNFIDVKSSTARTTKPISSTQNDLNQNTIANMTYNNHLNNQVNNKTQSHHWNDESNSGWTSTGVMSDRSSVYSIDDGDFDREASRKVGNQLRAIESVLYEQTSTDSSYLNECKEWLEKFPHIRILGSQITNYLREEQGSLENTRISVQSIPSTYRTNLNGTMSSNMGNSLNPYLSTNKSLLDASITQNNILLNSATNANNGNKKNTNNNNNNSNFSSLKFMRRRENTDINNQGLYLNGMNLPIRVADQETNVSENYAFLEEEIFDQEGVYEELLAYDNQEEEYLFEHNKRLNLNRRRKHGLPPITPKASMKDLVTSFLFDHMWSELIDWSMNLIKEYAKTVLESDLNYDSLCKTPTEPLSNTNQEKKEQNNTTNPNINTALFNNLNQTSYFNSNVTKASVVQLKPFDPTVNNSNNNNSTNNPLYSLIDKHAFTPGILSRDNSNLYAPSSKLSNNIENIDNKYIHNTAYSIVSDSGSTVGELMPSSNFGDLLRIKQLNRHGLMPISSQSRVGSGNRKPQLTNNYKKRYSSIEMSANPILDKNIIIHGAGLGRPIENQLVENKAGLNEKSNNALMSNSNYYQTVNNLASGANSLQMSRSNNSSSQAYHTQLHSSSNNIEDQNSSYENDYSDYQFNNFNNDMNENSIDEINLINNTHNNTNFNRMYYYNSNHIHYNHGHLKSSNVHPQLPPISGSLTSKPLRISSANNFRITKEKTERPLTSTATRNENLSNQKRSTTPSGQGSGGKGLGNLYPMNMKITGIRLSSDESSFYHSNNSQPNAVNSLNNFLSTKSFASINVNNSNSNIQNSSLAQQTLNRRNSIKESQGFQRIHK